MDGTSAGGVKREQRDSSDTTSVELPEHICEIRG